MIQVHICSFFPDVVCPESSVSFDLAEFSRKTKGDSMIIRNWWSYHFFWADPRQFSSLCIMNKKTRNEIMNYLRHVRASNFKRITFTVSALPSRWFQKHHPFHEPFIVNLKHGKSVIKARKSIYKGKIQKNYKLSVVLTTVFNRHEMLKCSAKNSKIYSDKISRTGKTLNRIKIENKLK